MTTAELELDLDAIYVALDRRRRQLAMHRADVASCGEPVFFATAPGTWCERAESIWTLAGQPPASVGRRTRARPRRGCVSM